MMAKIAERQATRDWQIQVSPDSLVIGVQDPKCESQ